MSENEIWSKIPQRIFSPDQSFEQIESNDLLISRSDIDRYSIPTEGRNWRHDPVRGGYIVTDKAEKERLYKEIFNA